MPYKGILKQGTPALVEVSAGATNSGPTALTVAKVVKKDRFAEVDAITVAPGAVGSTSLNMGGQAARLVVMVHPPVGGTALVKVTQGVAANFEQPIQGDTELVFDIVV